MNLGSSAEENFLLRKYIEVLARRRLFRGCGRRCRRCTHVLGAKYIVSDEAEREDEFLGSRKKQTHDEQRFADNKIA